MNILLLGYGKMGMAIEKIAVERGHTIAGRITIENRKALTIEQLKKADVAIEFSEPGAAVENIKLCLDNGIPVLSGTTGWLDQKEAIDAYTLEKNGTFFYASNYSIGVNLFFKLNKTLASLMGKYSEYNVDMEEIHHTEKKDAPSGTAITLAEGIMGLNPSKKQWINEPSDQKDLLPIVSKREAGVPGTHTVRYFSKIDEIEIKHTAYSREGFASGAVHVAEWISNKKGVLSMEDFLQL